MFQLSFFRCLRGERYLEVNESWNTSRTGPLSQYLELESDATSQIRNWKTSKFGDSKTKAPRQSPNYRRELHAQKRTSKRQDIADKIHPQWKLHVCRCTRARAHTDAYSSLHRVCTCRRQNVGSTCRFVNPACGLSNGT